MTTDNRALGIDRPIERRDFLGGSALALTGVLAGCGSAVSDAAQDQPGYDPPVLTGLRGSHPGSFEAAHALRDGEAIRTAEDTAEVYDLIVVGAGISGLAAAWFWRQRHPDARVLLLENHDDFGGHAKRNEFVLDGKLHLLNGGTLMIDSPRPYSAVAGGLLRALGIDPVALTAACAKPGVYGALTHGLFFDRATFGTDRLVAGLPGREAEAGPAAWQAFLARTPLSGQARADVLRVETGGADTMPGLDDVARKDRLSRMSYHDYLAHAAGVGTEAMAIYQTCTQGEWATGIDAVSALDCWAFGYPGFRGLNLVKAPHPRMSFTPWGYIQGGSDTFHFPDGNASIARSLVRALVPGALPGTGAAAIVGAHCDYARLDRPGSPVRMRLSSIVLNATHEGPPPAATLVRVVYTREGRVFSVRGRGVVMAGYNMMIPYLVPELPAGQRAALHSLVKAPLVYTSVAVRNWRPWVRAGVKGVTAPGSYYTDVALNWPVDIGAVTAERDPARPMLLHLTRTPCRPGLPEHDQYRAGRAELLATPFDTFERETRAQLAAMFAPHGFDAARDIAAITVNRWPHGYAPEYNYLWQPEVPATQMPHVVARARFGRIAIANSDSGNGAYTDVAIDQAWRAVEELA